MSHFDVLRETIPEDTYRTNFLRGRFDFRDSRIVRRFSGDLTPPEDWQIGVIIGPSGSGKTTIAKEIFGSDYIREYKYDKRSVVDDMPENASADEIAQVFSSVGFGSVPSWFKPYDILSDGERARVNVARALLGPNQLICMDEYTSVIDRKTAQLSSMAIEKYIRKTNKRFVAVTCHYDIVDWLRPDWVFDTETMTLEKKTLLGGVCIWRYAQRRPMTGYVLRTITI